MKKIWKYRRDLENKLITDRNILNLISIPGISFFSAALIKTEIADISRFKNFNKLCSHAGLAQGVHQSTDSYRYGTPLVRTGVRIYSGYYFKIPYILYMLCLILLKNMSK